MFSRYRVPKSDTFFLTIHLPEHIILVQGNQGYD